MTFVVTGATGQFGGLVVSALLAAGQDPDEIVAAGRDPQRLDALARLGTRGAHIDYDDVASLTAAFSGADAVLAVSAPGGTGRQRQHRNVIDAAESAGANRILYTSWIHADSSSMAVAVDHRATEVMLDATPVPHVVLRCAAYAESRAMLADTWIRRGELVTAAGDGRLSVAARADLASAAANALVGDGDDAATYELAGDEPFTMAEFAHAISERIDSDLEAVHVDEDTLRQTLVAEGMPERIAVALADHDRAIAAGEQVADPGPLRDLLGGKSRSIGTVLDETLDLASPTRTPAWDPRHSPKYT